MSFENFNNKEDKNPIELTETELELITNGDPNSPEVQKLLEEKGIEINSGLVEVKVNNRVFKIETREDDLGTQEMDYTIQ